jgi:hypothetical protein
MPSTKLVIVANQAWLVLFPALKPARASRLMLLGSPVQVWLAILSSFSPEAEVPLRAFHPALLSLVTASTRTCSWATRRASRRCLCSRAAQLANRRRLLHPSPHLSPHRLLSYAPLQSFRPMITISILYLFASVLSSKQETESHEAVPWYMENSTIACSLLRHDDLHFRPHASDVEPPCAILARKSPALSRRDVSRV